MHGVVEFAESRHQEYLTDESGMQGEADSISFPRNEDEVCTIVTSLRERNVGITVQGARTGLCGGAVPLGGHIMNVSRMKSVIDVKHDPERAQAIVRVQPGVLLSYLREISVPGASHRYFFPPDPTESTATVGGIVSCNAAGASSYGYGSTRSFVAGLRVVLSDGTARSLSRGGEFCADSRCGIEIDGTYTELQLPVYGFDHPRVSTGFPGDPNLDLVDLFIGAEGTLGIITAVDLRFVPEPEAKWGCACFFNRDVDARSFAMRLLEDGVGESETHLVGVEYLDSQSVSLVERFRGTLPAIAGLPQTDPRSRACVYFEIHGDTDESMSATLSRTVELIEACGGDADGAWAATEPRDLATLSALRHAVPEAVGLLMNENRRTVPGLTAIRADMEVPEGRLAELLDLFPRDLDGSGIEYIVYGHVGTNSVDVCLLPKSEEEYHQGREHAADWAETVAHWGGMLSAAHGIGKQKRRLVPGFVGTETFSRMQELKAALDPYHIINPGVIFGS